MDLKAAAIAYARLGMAVFPLYTPIPGGGCDCHKGRGCIHIGKHPRTINGHSDATTDEETIDRWWTIWPHANIGIACFPSNLVVLDIDPRHNGDTSLDILIERIGKAAFRTVTSATGGGGNHLVFEAPPGVSIGDVSNNEKYTGPLGPGIDVRAKGYFVAAPSLHESGALYEWEADWGPHDREPMMLPAEIQELLVSAPDTGEHTSRVDMKSILDGVPEGARDWQLYLAACKLRGADVPIDFAYQLIEEAAANCTPAFPRTDARKKVDSAYRHAPGKKAYAAAERAETDGPTAFMDMRVLLDEAVGHGIPAPPWLIKDVLVRGLIHNVYGEPESGKTILALAWMAQVAAAGERVVFIDEESGLASVASRMAAMGLEHPDDNIYYFPFTGLDLDLFVAVLASIDELRPALIVFDSLTDLLAASGMDENSGVDVTTWFKAIAETLSRRDYAPVVLLIDHTTKDTGNIRYSVGSRAKKSKSDVQWFVERCGEFDRLRTAPVLLHLKKNRPGVMPPVVKYTIGGEDGKLVCRREEYSESDIEAGLSNRAAEVLEVLRMRQEWTSNAQIRERLERPDGKLFSTTSVRDWCIELVKKGLVEAEGSTRDRLYRIRDSRITFESVETPNPTATFNTSPPLRGANVECVDGPETAKSREERLRGLGD